MPDSKSDTTVRQRLTTAEKVWDMYQKWKEDWAQGESAPEHGDPYNPSDIVARVMETVTND